MGLLKLACRILTIETNPDLKFSEDCLTLNVWTKPQVGEKGKAVLVWLHRGSYVSVMLLMRVATYSTCV